jgi:hypothetical protein
MYKGNIIIIGSSGTGKTTSLRNLPTDGSAVIFDLERKGLPFVSRIPVFTPESLGEFSAKFNEIMADTTTRIVVVDSFSKFAEMQLAVARATKKGYDIYSYYNEAVGRFLNSCKSKTKTVVVTAIDEYLAVMSPDGGQVTARRAQVAGKEHEGKVEKEFLVALFTNVKKKPNNAGMIYEFITNTDGMCSAKTPMGLFPSLYIDNDVMEVIEKVEVLTQSHN